MRIPWLWICLLLVLAQGVTVQVLRKEGPAPYMETGLPPDGWQALHRDTMSAWETYWSEAGPPAISTIADGLVERERKLLRLADLENALIESGLEAEVAQSARNWMQSARLGPAAEAALMEAYLHYLVEWFEAFAESPGEAGGRVNLLPGKGPLYPDIQFEMAADPVSAGRFMAALSERMPWWCLEHLALHEPSGESPWWTIGRLSFQESGRP